MKMYGFHNFVHFKTHYIVPFVRLGETPYNANLPVNDRTCAFEFIT